MNSSFTGSVPNKSKLKEAGREEIPGTPLSPYISR